MEIGEANNIINEYKKSLDRGAEGETVLRRISWLPCSKGKIKYAYFTVIEDIVEDEGILGSELKKELLETYSLLNTFVDDHMVDKYAKIYDEWQAKKSDFYRNKKDEMLAKQYINYTYTLRGDELAKELNDFVEDLLTVN